MRSKDEGLLIIGGSGFIGKNLIKHLKTKYDITSLSRTSKVQGVKNLNLDLNNSNFSFLSKNKFEYVVYLGTISSPKEAELKPQETFDSNVTTMQRFLEKSKELNLKKIILLSSVVLYSSGKQNKLDENSETSPFSSIYNYSKYLLESLAEFYRRKYSMPITVFRLANTYGPFQNTQKAPYLIPNLFQQALEKGKMEVWNAAPIRDWVFIDDVVKVLSKELHKKDGGIFNLGTGEGRSVRDVAKIIASLTGTSFSDLNRPVEPPYSVICNTEKLKERVGYVPSTTLEEGLKSTYNYFKCI